MSAQKLSTLLPQLFAALLLSVAMVTPVNAQQAASEPAQDNDAVSGEEELRQAYRREFAFLAAQKRDLEQRLNSFESERGKELANTRTAIDRLQRQVIALDDQVKAAREEAGELDKQRQSMERNADVLRATFTQASATFQEQAHKADLINSESFSQKSQAQQLNEIFGSALDLIGKLSSVRSEAGDFFTTEGDRRSGQIIHYGAVASYGVADDSAGILVPAGGGELKLWKDPAEDTARTLATGTIPSTLPMFIHGSRSAAVNMGDKGGALETIQKGGVIAWMIMLLALFAAVLVLARIAFLRRASASTGEIADEASELVANGKVNDAIELCRSRKGSTAAVVASALRNLHREREALDDIINENILHESSHLERFGTMILVIAAVSPLLGLLGTVTGMITTFEVITDHGTGDPQLLSGGISVALITTELGLMVAIPTLLIGNMLSGWADRIKDDMQKAALRVINRHQQASLKQARAA